MTHIPVLQKEVLEYLDPKADENFIDCTIGQGGHTFAILEKNGPNGKVLGIDADPEMIQCSTLKFEHLAEFSNRLVLVNDSYINLKRIVERENFKNVSGILFDLGMSSWHLEESGRGFSFLKNEPLDMRYGVKCQMSKLKCQNYLTAEEILNKWRVEELEKILREYGEEKFAGRIAKKIIELRKIRQIKTTFQLVEIVQRATPSWYHEQRINFATKTFQALRLAVNDELNNLEKSLPQALDILGENGRLAVISFQSLEDRLVKNFFRERDKKGQLKILTKKPIKPSGEETLGNPRSRSAKLRVSQKICRQKF